MDARTLTYTGIALVTWSSAYAAIAVALQHFTPGEIAFGRLAIAALCFSALIVARRVPLPQRSDWLRIGVLGVIGLTVYQLCLNQAETRISSGTAAILIALAPAATTTLSAVWIGERISGQRIAGLAVALAGVVMVVLSSGGHLKLEPMALLVLVSVAVSAVFFVAQKPLFARNSLVGVTGMGFVAAALGALPFGLHLPSSVSSAPLAPLLALVWLGVAPTFIGYLAWNAALTRVSASRLSTAIYFSAPLAVLIGWFWLGEQPGWLTLVGGVVVVGGVVLANARRKLAAPVVVPAETECCD